MTRSICRRAPTRIDFGGGWTDVPPYSTAEGGFVCNVAIGLQATARIRELPSPESPAIARTERNSDSPLITTALALSKVRGIELSLHNDFPVGAGLGGSSAAGVALHAALSAWRGESLDRGSLAERSRASEVEEMGIAGGRQDHYAAAFGGALALTFRDAVSVEQIELAPEVRAELESRCIVVYTGESRISGDTITAVIDSYRARDARVLFALNRMKELARQMAEALRRGDLDTLAALVGEHWAHQRALHPAIPTDRIDALIACAREAGARGAKALGASGGGCVLVMSANDNAESVRSAVSQLGSVLPFTINLDGVAPCT